MGLGLGLGFGSAAADGGRGVPLRLHVYSGKNRHDALEALAAGRESNQGPARLVILAAGAAEHAARSEAARRWLTGSGRPPEGVAFRETPIEGEVAFVFTNGAAAYRGMGQELMLAFPSIMDALEARCGPLADVVGWAYADTEVDSVHALDQIWGAGLLGQLHTEISRGLLGISPDAIIGYSSGESGALVAMGAWRDVPELVADARGSVLFTSALVGEFEAVRRAWRRLGVDGDRWMNYIVNASVEDVRAVLDREPAVHVMAINAPDSCVVGGEAVGCERVISRLGAERALPLDYEIAVHAPELNEVREQWWRLHYRPTFEVPDVRFYSCTTVDWYSPTPEAVADALTAQALGTVDFAATVERAWADGVRVFIEHGPQGLCSGWIRRILGDREHLAVAMDGRGVHQLTSTVAELVAAGVPMDTDPLFDHLARDWAPTVARAAEEAPASHPIAVRLPERESPSTQTMPRAPSLPLVPTAEPAVVTPIATSVPSRPGTALTVAGNIYRRTSARHQEFLTLQAEVHQRFLLSRRHAETVLSRTRDATRRGGVLAPQQVPVVQTPVPRLPARPHPTFDRAQLEQLASGRISELFGPRFAAQDGYERRTRLPRPPMLVLDRVTGIDAEPTSMGTGTIWTETDVRPDSWYCDSYGRMPVGFMFEAGQAILILLSWLGVDLLNKGERVYRLLGAELTFHGSPPLLGETFRGETRLDGHGDHDGVRLSFFHSTWYVGDEPRMTARDCIAGFFTETELAASGGVLWDPASESPGGSDPLDPPVLVCSASRFGPDAVRAFADGRPADCFGPGWERTRSHVRSPRISAGQMLLINEVTEFSPTGGPWRRGYLRAETPVSPEDWFFEAHFINDPCMPGSLMFEGCLQALAFYLAATGHTVNRDGWRFEPVPDHAYRVRCGGQVTPDSRGVTYEVFVREMSAGPEPTLFADILCTVDGVKAFHVRRLGLRLVPDWPLSYWRQLGPPAVQTTGEPVAPQALGGLRGYQESKPVAEVDGFRFDYASLLAYAWGKPSEAFGPTYAGFDSSRRIARLPGPPYSFMSRIVSLDGPFGGMKAGTRVEVEYDVPEEVWYFEQNGHPTMPFGVLMEVVLQACGWLGFYVGSALTTGIDLLVRNLDGTGTVTGEIRPGTRTLRTRAELSHVSQGAGVIIMSFDVECFADGQPVFKVSSGFGYFGQEAFENQVGLPPSDAERAQFEALCDRVVDLTQRPARYCNGSLRLAGPMLLMLDRITGYWPDGGEAGLGRLRAEKDVDPGAWFFKAHFFQDPVQPGSLGVEGMCQLLQFYLIERDFGAGLRHPRFEPVMQGHQVTWKYRGQVVPANERITIEMEILEAGDDERGRYAVAQAWLWVDGKRIYHVKDLGMRVVEGATGDAVPHSVEQLLDPAVDTWLLDHCPTFTSPSLPMMSTVDLLARAAAAYAGRPAVALRDVQLRRWVPLREAVRLRTEVSGSGDELDVTLLVWREAATRALSRFELLASSTVRVGRQTAECPAAPEPLADAELADVPYSSGVVFHGPSFQYLVSLRMGAGGASGVLDAGRGSVPRGALNQGLLDAATHVVPHDQLWRWSDEISRDVVGYPHKITAFELFAPLPDTGKVYVEARFAGFDHDDRMRPVFDLWLSDERRLLATIRLVDALMPKGRLGSAELGDRRAFLRDRRYVGGIGISVTDGDVTSVSIEDVDQFDWLVGTVAHVYDLPAGAQGRDHLALIAIRDHVARLARVHPSAVEVAEEECRAWPKARLDELYHLHVEQTADHVVVRSVIPPR